MIAETTFSLFKSVLILTPCVFLPLMPISLTFTLITFPLSVEIIISSSGETGKDEETFPFLGEVTIFIIPLPPLLVTL